MLPDGVRLRDRIGHGEVVAAECWDSADTSSMAAASRLVLDIILLLLYRAENYRRQQLGVGDIVPSNHVAPQLARREAAYSGYMALFHPTVRLAQSVQRGIHCVLQLPHCNSKKQLPAETFLPGSRVINSLDAEDSTADNLNKQLLNLDLNKAGSVDSDLTVTVVVAAESTTEPCVQSNLIGINSESCLTLLATGRPITGLHSTTLEEVGQRYAAACASYHGHTLFRPREEYEYLRLLSQVAAGVAAAGQTARMTAEAKLGLQEAKSLRSRQRATLRYEEAVLRSRDILAGAGLKVRFGSGSNIDEKEKFSTLFSSFILTLKQFE